MEELKEIEMVREKQTIEVQFPHRPKQTHHKTESVAKPQSFELCGRRQSKFQPPRQRKRYAVVIEAGERGS